MSADLPPKPQIQVIRTLNLIEAFDYVSKKHYANSTSLLKDAGYQNVWSFLYSVNYLNNDTTTAIHFPDLLADHRDGAQMFSKEGVEYVERLIEEFDLTSVHMKNIQWVICW